MTDWKPKPDVQTRILAKGLGIKKLTLWRDVFTPIGDSPVKGHEDDLGIRASLP